MVKNGMRDLKNTRIEEASPAPSIESPSGIIDENQTGDEADSERGAQNGTPSQNGTLGNSSQNGTSSQNGLSESLSRLSMNSLSEKLSDREGDEGGGRRMVDNGQHPLGPKCGKHKVYADL